MTQQSHSRAYTLRKSELKRHMYRNVHCNTIYNSQDMEACPSTEERLKMLYIYTMRYYSAIKRNKIVPFVEMWMDLETVIQSEVRKRKTNIIY